MALLVSRLQSSQMTIGLLLPYTHRIGQHIRRHLGAWREFVNWRQWIQLWGVIFGVGFGSMAMAQVPGVFHFSGELNTNNGALTDTIDVQIALYDDPVLGGETHELWAEMQTVTVTQGRFHVMLGADEINPILPSTFQKAAVYVGITVGSDSEMTPRSRVGTVPYASLAGDAATLGGVSASSYVTQTGLDSAGYVTGAHTVDTFRSDADILTVVGPHTVDNNTQLSKDQVLTMVSDGGYAPGAHTVNSDTLGDLQCSTDQIARWNGSQWACTADSKPVAGDWFLSRTASGYNKDNWQTVGTITPSTAGNHMTLANIKLQVGGYTGNCQGNLTELDGSARFTIHYASGETYTSSTYKKSGSGYETMYDEAIPIHNILVGTVTQVSLEVKGSSSDWYCFGNVGTMSGYATITIQGYELTP
jgi:hypothetical protein